MTTKRTEKDIALDAIQRLPDDATYEDIIYAVYFHHSVEEGLEDMRQGRTVSHEEVMREINEWLAAPGLESASAEKGALPS